MIKNEAEVSLMIKKAENKLKTAKIDFESGQYDDAISRAYYAVFHSISAVLFAKDLHFSSHSQTIGSFNKEFIKTQIFSSDFTKIIQKLFDNRQTGDYDFESFIDKETAEEDIQSAELIVTSCKKYIEQQK